MLNNLWTRHFRLLVALVVVLGLVIGAAAAAMTRPSTAPVAQQGQNAASAQNGQTGARANTSAAGATQQGTTAQDPPAQAGMGMGMGGAGRGVFGTVDSVDSATLTVRGQQGDVKVALAGAKVSKTVEASATDLKAGDRVTVTARQEADGSYTASTVQIIAADLPQGGMGTAPAQGAGGTRTPGQQGGGSRAQGQGQQGGSVRLSGTVSAVEGSTLALSGPQGEARVKLGSARIEKQAEGTAADLKAGQQVAVMGQQGADGTYTSSQIQILPAAG